MDEFGGFIAEQIIRAVRDAASKKASASPQVEKLRAVAEAEAARQRAARAARPGGPGAPSALGTGSATPGRRAPKLTAATPAPPAAPRAAAPVPPAPPGGRDRVDRALPADDLFAPAPPAPLTLDDGLPALEPIAPLVADFDFGPSPAPARRTVRSGLLAAFANSESLIAGIVLGEALAPPISLRPGGAHREER